MPAKMKPQQLSRLGDLNSVLDDAPRSGAKVYMDKSSKASHYILWWNDFGRSFRIGVGATIPMKDGSTFTVDNIYDAAMVCKALAHFYGWSLEDIDKAKPDISGISVLTDESKSTMYITASPSDMNTPHEPSTPIIIAEGEQSLIPRLESYYDQKVNVKGLDVTATILQVCDWAIQHGWATLFIGPPGCGKTEAVKHMAAKLNRPFRRVNLSGGTTTDDLLGRWVLRAKEIQGKDGSVAAAPETVWKDGVVIDAMRKGHILTVDEINAAEDSVLFVLRSLLDGSHSVTLTEKDGEVVQAHPEFRFFATANPSEEGVYGGTHELNAADVERFPQVLYMDYLAKKDEIKCVCDKASNDVPGLAGLMVKFAQKVRAVYGKMDGVRSIISTRKLIDWMKMCKLADAHTAFAVTIYHKLRTEDRKPILDMFTSIFKVATP